MQIWFANKTEEIRWMLIFINFEEKKVSRFSVSLSMILNLIRSNIFLLRFLKRRQ